MRDGRRGLLAGAVRDDDFVNGDIRLPMPRFVQPQLTHNLAVGAAFGRGTPG